MTATSDPLTFSFPDLRGARVLLIDDYADTLVVIQTILECCGAEVRATVSADDALDEFDRYTPDVVVSDLSLPGHDGLWLMREIRRRPHERGAGVPAIAITAYPAQYVRQAALDAGFQTFIMKPVDPTALCQAVARLLPDARGRSEMPAGPI